MRKGERISRSCFYESSYELWFPSSFKLGFVLTNSGDNKKGGSFLVSCFYESEKKGDERRRHVLNINWTFFNFHTFTYFCNLDRKCLQCKVKFCSSFVSDTSLTGAHCSMAMSPWKGIIGRRLSASFNCWALWVAPSIGFYSIVN